MTTQLQTSQKLRTHLFRGCRRCGGDLRLERERDSILDPSAMEYVCLQCGRRMPLEAVLSRPVTRAAGKAI